MIASLIEYPEVDMNAETEKVGTFSDCFVLIVWIEWKKIWLVGQEMIYQEMVYKTLLASNGAT